MTTRLEYVQAGDPLLRSADDRNALTAAARQVPQLGHSGGRAVYTRDQNVTVLIRNDSGEQVNWGEPLEITGLAISAIDNRALFRHGGTALLTGERPSADLIDEWVVTAEPIRDGKIGRAYLWGVFPGYVDFGGRDPAEEKWCNPRKDWPWLFSHYGGECRILAYDDTQPASCLLSKVPLEQYYIGKADEDIAKGAFGTISRYSRGGYNTGTTSAKGSEVDTGINDECFARHGTVSEDDFVQYRFTDGDWEIVQVDCES